MNTQRLLNLLNDSNLPELFEELDRLNIQDSRYARFKQEFIGGFHSFDFWDRLKVFILQLDKPQNNTNTKPKGENTNLSISQLKEIAEVLQPKIEISPKFENIGNPVITNTNTNTNQNTLSNQQAFQIEAFRKELFPLLSRLETVKEDLEEVPENQEIKSLLAEINKLLKSAEKVNKEEDKDKIKQSAFVTRLSDFYQFIKKEGKSLLPYLAPENLKKIEESTEMIKEIVEKV